MAHPADTAKQETVLAVVLVAVKVVALGLPMAVTLFLAVTVGRLVLTVPMVVVFPEQVEEPPVELAAVVALKQTTALVVTVFEVAQGLVVVVSCPVQAVPVVLVCTGHTAVTAVLLVMLAATTQERTLTMVLVALVVVAGAQEVVTQCLSSPITTHLADLAVELFRKLYLTLCQTAAQSTEQHNEHYMVL